ncbi:hypothetical protein [Arcobacter roscoffensis]|uniref:Polyhydroxyalkanoate synthesis regulator n=1 Tax=Arcobacter roscoffensis TaxID=2961520 RepID=A0ABY5E1Y5_9BACT|nr:hypothetical protein [Arcobacter roscoffensis]UTJ05098.1 hypothetical protein NJU99_07400 [Arcobacter roscoffensis]|tara:strand:+ start:95 stop:358 length:264 start_codon:yes stop_codon:yes gene_type:complete
MLKELIFTGLGATAVIKDKVEDELKKLEEKGKIDSSDVKGFIESLEKKGQDEEEKFKKHIKDSLKEAINELGLVTKKDLEKLKKDLK